MKLEVLLSLWLLSVASMLGADPMGLRWQAELPRAEAEHHAITSTVGDHLGNFYISYARRPLSGAASGIIVKLDGDGEEAWRFELPDSTEYYIQDLAADSAGNIYATSATATGSVSQEVFLFKLSAAGEELWRCPLGVDPDWNRYHKSRISSDGTVSLAFYRDVQPGEQYMVIKRVSPAGNILWSTEFLGIPDYDLGYSTAEAIALDAENNLYVAARKFWPDLVSLLCKLDSNGQILWAKEIPGLKISHVLVSGTGLIAVSGMGGYRFYDAAGALQHQSSVRDQQYVLHDSLSDGRILLERCFDQRSYLQLITPTGEVDWMTMLPAYSSTKFRRNPVGGWLVSGMSMAGTTISVHAIAEDGSQRWSQVITDSLTGTGASFDFYTFMEVQAGRLNLAVNTRVTPMQYSVVAASFDLPETLPPSLIQTHPQGTAWEKGASLTLSTSAIGAGPYAYRWYFMGDLLDEQTGPTLTLTPGQFPVARGFYQVEISTGEQTTISPIASVELEGIYLESLDSTNAGKIQLRITAGIGRRFQLQTSVDLASWIDYPSMTNTSAASVETSSSGSSRFFRAVQVD